MFAGLRAEHGADALVFAVMEGVAFSFADGVDVLDAAGARPVRPLLVGGGARSDFWGADDRRRDGPHDRPRAGRGSGRGARRGPARHARGRRRQRRSRLHAPADCSAHSSPTPRAPRCMRRASSAIARSTRPRKRREPLKRGLWVGREIGARNLGFLLVLMRVSVKSRGDSTSRLNDRQGEAR